LGVNVIELQSVSVINSRMYCYKKYSITVHRYILLHIDRKYFTHIHLEHILSHTKQLTTTKQTVQFIL